MRHVDLSCHFVQYGKNYFVHSECWEHTSLLFKELSLYRQTEGQKVIVGLLTSEVLPEMCMCMSVYVCVGGERRGAVLVLKTLPFLTFPRRFTCTWLYYLCQPLPILEMRKLRFREVKELLKVTELVRGGSRIWTSQSVSKTCVCNCGATQAPVT